MFELHFDPDAPVLALDFDATITDGFHFGKPLVDVPVRANCVEVTRRLHEAGCVIVLWTCRSGRTLQEAIDYCQYQGIPIDFVNEDVPWCGWPKEERGPKIGATFYIDDRGIGGLPTWPEIEKIVMQHPYFRKKAS